MSKLSNLESKLEKYRDKLEFIQEANRLVIRNPKYLPSKEWSEVDSIIHGEDGIYVPKNKGGPFWTVPSSNEVAKPQKPAESYASFHCPYCNKVINFTVGAPK